MPMLVQICIAVATVALIAAAIALLRFLSQAQRTAKQLERTMAHFESDVIPPLGSAVQEMRNAFDSVQKIMIRMDRISSGIEHVSGKALDISDTVVNRVLAPATQVKAIVEGLRTGASFLFGNGRGRARNTESQRSGGGNHHARPEVQ